MPIEPPAAQPKRSIRALLYRRLKLVKYTPFGLQLPICRGELEGTAVDPFGFFYSFCFSPFLLGFHTILRMSMLRLPKPVDIKEFLNTILERSNLYPLLCLSDSFKFPRLSISFWGELGFFPSLVAVSLDIEPSTNYSSQSTTHCSPLNVSPLIAPPLNRVSQARRRKNTESGRG
jgi:hypothetical protein